VKRPFTRTFDLISSEYGWTDDQILDLTLTRIRQVREVILTRQGETREQDLTVEERKLQALVGAIHAAAGNKKGAAAAQEIRLFERSDGQKPQREVPRTEAVLAQFGGVDRLYGLFTQEQIDAEAARLKAEGLVTSA
jgi:hypothetical protein